MASVDQDVVRSIGAVVNTDTRLHGVIPILHTPFDAAGAIDLPSLANEVEYCIDLGADGVAFGALASEFFALSEDERILLGKAVISTANGRVPVVIGVTAATRRLAVTLAEGAVSAGASALLALPPYPRQAPEDARTQYFGAIADAAGDTPLILQNQVPPVGQHLGGAELTRLLDAVPTIRYVKEEGNPSGPAVSALLAAEGHRLDGVFSANFGLTQVLDALRGACGLMPGVGLLEQSVRIHALISQQNVEGALAEQSRLQLVASFVASYPTAVDKVLLHRRGVIATPAMRDPQVNQLDASELAELDLLLAASGIST
jgi:dihydrodipicolinate synthase/N-acetylneuraminate lyase